MLPLVTGLKRERLCRFTDFLSVMWLCKDAAARTIRPLAQNNLLLCFPSLCLDHHETECLSFTITLSHVCKIHPAGNLGAYVLNNADRQLQFLFLFFFFWFPSGCLCVCHFASCHFLYSNLPQTTWDQVKFYRKEMSYELTGLQCRRIKLSEGLCRALCLRVIQNPSLCGTTAEQS